MGFIGRAVAPAPITANDVPDLPASKITSGQFSNSLISASSVSQHATSFDDNNIVNDLSTLGLRVHSQENLNASNSNSASFDVFQDSSGITNLTNVTRDSNEFMSTSSITAEAGGTEDDPNAGGWTGYTASGPFIFSFESTTPGYIETYYASTTLNFSSYTSNEVDGKFWLRWKIANTTSGSENTTNQKIQLGIMNNTDSINVGASLLNTSNASNKPEMFLVGYNAKDGNTLYFWKGGTLQASVSKTLGANHSLQIVGDGSTLKVYHSATENNWYDSGADLVHTFTGFTDSGSAKRMLIGNGNNNTPTGYRMAESFSWKENITTMYGQSFNATGSFEGATITAGASTSSMGAVITYQDNAGTNALNTDIILKLSADNGSNYSTATLTALPDFATGIKMAKVNDLSVTAGTQLKYKIEFANQSSGVKEARIRGVSLQY